MTSGLHESYVEHREIKGPSERSFGLTVGAILLAIGLVRGLFFQASTTNLLFIMPGGILLILGLVAPRLLAMPNRLWTNLGLFLARIVNPLIMLAMFILIFVPVALVMRIARRDALRLRRDPTARSYWIERNPPGPEPQTMIHQF